MISIRHARPDEKKKTYEWLCLSDTTCLHMGVPDYPDSPVPTWDEFQEDFKDVYFQGENHLSDSVMIIENDGIEMGCLCYACFHLKPESAELDIWLARKEYCGRGFGTEALKLLISYLNVRLGIKRFLIRPSNKNIRALRAYEKAGFRHAEDRCQAVVDFLKPEFIEKYGQGDYGFCNTAVMVLEIK